jgi:hypothetical protein
MPVFISQILSSLTPTKFDGFDLVSQKFNGIKVNSLLFQVKMAINVFLTTLPIALVCHLVVEKPFVELEKFLFREKDKKRE